MIGAHRQYHQCPYLGEPWQRTLQKHVGGHKVGAVSLVDSYGSDNERREEKTHTRDEMGKGPVAACYDSRPSDGIYMFMLRRLRDKYDRKRLNVKMKVKGCQPCWRQTHAAPDVQFQGYGRGCKVE